MKHAARASRALALVGLVTCAGAAPKATSHATMAVPKAMRIVRASGHASLAIVTRDGDPTGAVAAFVSTSGIGHARGAVVPTALAGIFESRGLLGARITPQDNGVRIVLEGSDLGKLAAMLLEPVTTTTELGPAKRKVFALGILPHVPPELSPVLACEGALTPPGDTSLPTTTELEEWRKAAVVNERVGFGIVGSSPSSHAPSLPTGSSDPASNTDALPALAVYDQTASTIALTWRADMRLLGVARALGAEHSPLLAMLSTDPGVHVRSVTAALSARGVCMTLRAELDADAASAGSARAASLVALATKEARVALAADDGSSLSPDDALEAAEQAAIIALAVDRAPPFAAPHVVIGAPSPPTAAREMLARAIDAATRAWDAPVIDARVDVEAGQPASWLLVASPCGTVGESDADAGASAIFALAAARAARDMGIQAEPWIAADGIGILASGRDLGRIADIVARSLIVDPIDGARSAQGKLLDAVHPALAALAQTIAAGRPSSMLPTGTSFALLGISDGAVRARAEALRRGPLRISVIATSDVAQGEMAKARVDRWVSRDPNRACPAQATVASAKAGTYAIATDDGTSEAYLAAMVPSDAEAEAVIIAGALDGAAGLLEKSLGDGLARSYGAHVLGLRGARAIVIHLEAPAGALDTAVAQTRALLDRMRQGAITVDDVKRAEKNAEQARAARLRDPRERLIALFRGEAADRASSLDRVRAAAATTLRDDALVIVAARPQTSRVPQKRAP